jgi:hypothetical protein
MEAAERAQGALVLSTEVIPASPAAITALDGMSGDAAVEDMGLIFYQEQVEQDHLSEEE